MNCGDGVWVGTTPHLKKVWLCGLHNHTKTDCGLDPYFQDSSVLVVGDWSQIWL